MSVWRCITAINYPYSLFPTPLRRWQLGRLSELDVLLGSLVRILRKLQVLRDQVHSDPRGPVQRGPRSGTENRQ